MECKRVRQDYRRRWMKVARAKLSVSQHRYASSSEELEHMPSARANEDNTREHESNCCSQNNVILESDGSRIKQQTEEACLSQHMLQPESDSDVDCVYDIWDAIDSHIIESEEESDSENKDCAEKLADGLVLWSNSFNVKQNAIDGLLKLLKTNIPQLENLPSSCRTLMKTPKAVELSCVSGMQYYYFGLQNQIISVIGKADPTLVQNIETLELVINIDGLPLFKSSRTCLWPVLCMLRNIPPACVFPVTVTSGSSKPSDLKFLSDIVQELKHLLNRGIDFGNRHFSVCLKCIVCDAPAKALVKATKLCSGYFGCDKCNIKGEWFGRVTFPETAVQLRTDKSFRQFQQEEHHQGLSPFAELPVDMIDNFAIDYMHQVCLGVMKRMLLIWIRGERRNRISATHVKVVSERLINLQHCVPDNFARKRRGLEDIDRWKAVEYRQFLLYTGQIVLKDILSEQLYDHFMCLSVAVCILVNGTLSQKHNAYAHELLVYFVERSKALYGDEFLVYSVHSLIHLSHESVVHGSLENCAAWKFESFMQVLKKLVRSGKNPVAQVVKRIKEQNVPVADRGFPRARKSSARDSFSTKLHNSGYSTKNGYFCEIVTADQQQEAVAGSTKLFCRVYKTVEPVFTKPCDSRLLGFAKVHENSAVMTFLTASSLQKKCFVIDQGTWKVFKELLHETSSLNSL